MADYKNRTKRNDDTEDNNTKKRIILFIVLIVIILLLLVSCGISSNFFGKLGNIFNNSGTHEIDEDSGSKEPVINKDLKFNVESLEIEETDTKTKIRFSYDNINPKEFKCSTSDGDIASCYVEDDYVVIKPYKPGTVTITLETITNDKIYKATTEVTIKESKMYIELSSKSGTINLFYGKTRTFSYKLVGISGDVKVSSSDEKVATASVKNKIITVKAKKVGKATITVLVEYNGKTYSKEYYLTVVNNQTASSGNNSGGSETEKNSDSLLSNLKVDSGILTPDFSSNVLEYTVGVSWWTWNIGVEATANNSYAQNNMTYSYKRADRDEFETVKSIDKLPLKTGDNILYITVTAEDGSKTVYKVTINRGINNYLDNISTSVGSLSPEFDKQKLEYTIVVPSKTDKITLTATSENKNSEISATFDGVPSNLVDMELLTPGTHTVKINVTHHGSTRTYTLKIIKETGAGEIEESTELSSLIITNHEIRFTPSNNKYFVGLPYDESSINITPTTTSPNAEVYYTYNNGVKVKVSSGEAITIEDIEPGKDNKLAITVENGGVSKDYEIIINRATNPYGENGSTALKSLTSNKTMTPEFSKDITKYNIDLSNSESSVSLFATPEDKNAKVEYCYNGTCSTSGNITDIPEGETTTVSVKVTNKANEVRNYVIDIYREKISGGGGVPSTPELSSDATLNVFTINGVDAKENNNIHILASKEQKSDAINNITSNISAKDSGATIEYYIDGIKYTTKNQFADALNKLTEGTHDIKIVVTSQDGKNTTEKEITLTIDAVVLPNNQDTILGPVPSSNKEVTGEFYAVNNSPDLKRISQILTIANQNNTTFKLVVADGHSSQTANSLEGLTLNLQPGWNTLTIYYEQTTQARATVRYTYIIHIYVPKLTVKLSAAGSTLENGKLSLAGNLGEDSIVLYDIIEKNYTNLKAALNNELTSTTLEVNAKNESKYKQIVFEIEDGIDLIQNVDISNKSASVTLKPKSRGAFTLKMKNAGESFDTSQELIVTVTADVLKVEPVGEIFVVDLIDGNKTGNVILATDYFKEHEIDNSGNENNKVCSKDKKNCIEVQVENGLEFADVHFKLDMTEKNPTSLTLEVVGKSQGEVTLKVIGTTYNEVEKEELLINVSVREMMNIILNADEGTFGKDDNGNEIKTYSYKAQKDKVFKMSDMASPYKSAENECSFHKLEGYTLENSEKVYKSSIKVLNGKVLLDGIDEVTVTGNRLELYAKYSSSTALTLSDINEKAKWLAIGNVPLFNEYSSSGERSGKPIYPGTMGSYEAILKNGLDEPIYITGIQIDEVKTICVDNVGCLNMGYVVKAYDPEEEIPEGGSENKTLYTYYVKNGQLSNPTENYPDKFYKVLNSNYKAGSTGFVDFTQMQSKNDRDITNVDEGKLESLGKAIKVEPNSQKSITIHWKWVELDDKVDTAVSAIATDIGSDKYAINVFLKYTVYSKTCDTTKKE